MNEYLLYRAADVASRCMPRRFGYWVALRIADCYYRFSHTARRAVISNLRRIQEYRGLRPSGEKLDRMARSMFQHFGKYLVDFFRFSEMTDRQMERLVGIEHVDLLHAAAAADRGIIILTAHLGNWELAGGVLAWLGHTPRAVVLPERLKRLNDLFQRRRRKRGIKPIPLGQAVRGLLRALSRKECVALLGDRDFSPRQDLTPFFGAPARLPRGPAWLAMHAEAPLVPMFLLRQPDDTFLLRFHAPIFCSKRMEQDEARDRILLILEEEIGRNPEQWYIFDDFWQTDQMPDRTT